MLSAGARRTDPNIRLTRLIAPPSAEPRSGSDSGLSERRRGARATRPPAYEFPLTPTDSSANRSGSGSGEPGRGGSRMRRTIEIASLLS